PDDLLYVVFTSGSTGIPKGAMITHANFSSAIQHQQAALGFTAQSRVFDYVSYAFDVAWSNALHTLTAGGCLCIPSNENRFDSIAESINKLGATYLHLTPTVAQLVSAQDVPGVQTIAFIGERLSRLVALSWESVYTVLNTYGPAECTVTATLLPVPPGTQEDPAIGHECGTVVWVVQPDGKGLVSIGETGELWIEGPLVGRGYLGDPDKTAAAFIEDPAWLVRGGPGSSGRHGRLYRTGDLVRYDSDGVLHFVGRKDDQVKIRGQRVELGEIEHHLRQCLDFYPEVDVDVVADVIRPAGSETAMLVAFLTSDNAAQENAKLTMERIMADIDASLGDRLPAHMVPGAYIPIDRIPMTGTGKTDRICLRKIGTAMTLKQLAALDPARSQASSRTMPATEAEIQLQRLWAGVLGISPDSIAAEDSFLRIGGDSVAAMRLVGRAREHGLLLTVMDVFRWPRLTDLAKKMTGGNSTVEPATPFSLLRAKQPAQTVRKQAARYCHLPADQIQDVFPCTPLQEGLLAITARQAGKYVAHNIFPLQRDVDAKLLTQAWNLVVETNDILRTRIIDLPEQGLVQVILSSAAPCTVVRGDLANYVQTDKAQEMRLGMPLTRAIVVVDNGGACYFVWTIHHALYDNWSLPLLLDQLERAYSSDIRLRPTPFQGFIKHITSLDSESATQFWQSQLADCEAAPFPPLPSPSHKPQADRLLQHTIADFCWPQTDVTLSTILRAAWAIVISRHTASDDVVFGAVSNGRQAPVPGIERMAGPTIATVPVRVKLQHEEASVSDMLSSMQSQAVEMVPHEQFGLSSIRKLGRCAEQACQFQSIFVVQPKTKTAAGSQKSTLFSKGVQNKATMDLGNDVGQFVTYSLMVMCHLHNQGIDIELRYDATVVAPALATHLSAQFDQVFRQLCDPKMSHMPVDAIETTWEQDLCQIWAWNAAVPETIEACVHNLFTERAYQQPDAPAICAWDGELTYGKLDALSTQLAHRLAGLGAGPGTIVPLCFEKSMWTPVAMLAVMKAGAASAAMDTTQPASRLRAIVQQTLSHSSHCQLILSSTAHQTLAGELVSELASGMAAHVLVVVAEKEAAQGPGDSNGHGYPPLKQASPQDLLCVVFTSGSTGVPKGTMLTHSNFSSAIRYQQDLPLISHHSRVFDFASYAFDAAWHNLLCSLTAGATLCIPNQEERMADLSGAIRRYSANYILLPPTAARLLSDSNLAYLETIVLGGELVVASDAAIWNKTANAFNIYGPAECTVLSTAERLDVNTPGSPSIGRGCGTVVWVIQPDGKGLVSIGETGELWIEGPLVGRGYLGDPDKTAAAFIEDPAWLVRGGPGSSGRHGRLYRTGDLARYDANGKLHFVGRKDDQVKIRGQRVELGEIEHHLKYCLAAYPGVDVVAEVVRPAGSERPTLVAVLALGGVVKKGTTLEQIVADIDIALGDRLPIHMIPGAYIPVDRIPMTATGKTDRLRLREMGVAMTLEQLTALHPARGQGSRTAPATEAEIQLQQLWAGVLGISPDSIAAEDSFLRTGGDSVAAMRLVGRARDQGFLLTVADVFQWPRLRDLARKMTAGYSMVGPVAPFSLLRIKQPEQTVRDQAARCCHLPADQIQDVFPCTPLQEGLLAMTAKQAGEYVARNILQLRNDVNTDSLAEAWNKVMVANDILRTQIVDMPEQGLVQVVLRTAASPIDIVRQSLNEYVQTDKEKEIGMGKPLTRAAVIIDSDDGTSYFIWTIHHALYDGWSMPLLLDQLQSTYYSGSTNSFSTPFQSFIKHITTSTDSQFPTKYWQAQFADCEATPFPALPSPLYQPQASQILQHAIVGFRWPQTDTTPSTLLRAAWAIVVGHHTASDDVAFGAVSNGRQAPVPGIERMAGPAIATVPVRVKLQADAQVTDLLSSMQSQAVDMVPHEQFGLSNIQKLGAGAAQACQFQSLLVVHPRAEGTIDRHLSLFVKSQSNEATGVRLNQGSFMTYALNVICQLNELGIDIEFRYDARVVAPAFAALLVEQFDQVFRQLCQAAEMSPCMPVKEINTTREQDLQQIWAWNAVVPETVEACVHDLFTQRARQQPDAPAICAWDGELTYSDLDAQSTRLAQRLARLGAGPGTIVPLCFEKSMWTPVAMLAVMKAGAASATMDTTQPASRLRAIVQQALSHSSQCQLILSSEANQALAGELVSGIAADVPIVIVAAAEEAVQGPGVINSRQPPLAQATPQDLLYVVFTSGSTGVPKGAMVTHANFSSAIQHQQTALGFTSQTRVFDYVSYAFDVAWSNTLHTLTAGGCLCVPSNKNRFDLIAKSINTLGATYLHVTPTVAQFVSAEDLPGVRTIAFIGERLSRLVASSWESVDTVLNTYGPAECTVTATLFPIQQSREQDDPAIGKGCGAVVWVVRPDGEGPVSIGEIGELWIEGPLVGRGYLGDPDKTAAAFIEDPAWLVRGGPGAAGRRGRLYRTGDLVRYDADGVLHFVGRKDDQVKIRGQRVELGEIEHHLRQCLDSHPDVDVVADVVRPAESETTMLVAFLALGTAAAAQDDTTMERVMTDINARLGDWLPTHMIPGAYIPVDRIPMTATGKTDRLRLRQMGTTMTLEQLSALNPARSRDSGSRTAPTTEADIRLQQLWASVLGISPDSIAAEDSFLRIGGDSVAAMRLVGRAHEQGFSLNVTDVFRHPRLCDLAKAMRPARPPYIAPSPFSLIPYSATSPALAPYSAVFKAQGATIVDILPTTYFQQRCIRIATSTPLGFSFHFFMDFPVSVDPHRIIQLCEIMWQQFDILRAVFVKDGATVLQLILSGVPLDLTLHEVADPDEFSQQWCANDLQLLQLGQSYVRSLLCYSPAGKRRLVLRLSHAQYDGIAIGSIVRLFDDGLHERPIVQPVSFAGYMHQVQTQRSSCLQYWQGLLKGAEITPIPARHADLSNLRAGIHYPSHHVREVINPPKMNNTAASVFVATCALAIAKFSGAQDVVFGLLVSGRSTLPGLLADVSGPCVNTIPIRVDTGAHATFKDMVAFVQDQMISSSDFELCQLSDIKASMGCGSATEFGFEVQFQGIDESPRLAVSGERIQMLTMDRVLRGLPVHQPVLSIFATPHEGIWDLNVTGWLCDVDAVVSLMDWVREAISTQR
ncbi:acetyl-CoA synthetase-like protein, partial [Colletotrichum somersetense]